MPYSLTLLDEKITTVSGDLVSQITTVSGDLAAQIGVGSVTTEQLTTTSGDIVSQIPSLSGYATQVWVSNQNYASEAELTTTSGDIVLQIPSLSGYATESWTTQEITTTSGDLIDYINTVSGSINSRIGNRVPFIVDVGPGLLYETIQSGIDACDTSGGDYYLIRVFPGLYVEDVVLKDNVDMVGLNYSACILEGSVSWPSSTCTASGWSCILDMYITATSTVSGYALVTIEEGQHDLNNLWLVLTMEEGQPGHVVKMSGGELHGYLPEYQYYQLGESSPDTEHKAFYQTGGNYQEQSGEIFVESETSVGRIIGYDIDCPNLGDWAKLLNPKISITNTAPLFDGEVNGICCATNGVGVIVEAGYLSLRANAGGEGFAYHLDASEVGSSDNRLISNANRIEVEGFSFNYFAETHNPADMVVSHFDTITAQDGFEGDVGTVSHVHSDAYGQLHLNKYIEFSPSAQNQVDRDLLVVNIGTSSPSVLRYQNLTNPRLLWKNPEGYAGFTVEGLGGGSNLGSAIGGDEAFNYDALVTMRQDTTISGIRRWRLKSEAYSGDFVIDHYRTTLSGQGTPVMFRQTGTGMTSLRYGDQVDRFLNESDMVSYSPYALPTQKSVVDYITTVSGHIREQSEIDELEAKAYVDAYIKPYRYLSVSASGGDFQSIQEAIDSITITDFDTEFWAIQVHPGIYYEDIYPKDNIDIIGDSYDACIIEGSVNWLATSGCSVGLWSSIQNLTIQSHTTTSGFCNLCATAGEHDMVNCYVYTEADGVGANCIELDGGNVFSYLTMYEYYGVGDSPGHTHRCVRSLSGRWESQADVYLMTIDDSTDSTILFGAQRSENPDDYFRFQGSSADMFVTTSGYSGTVCAIRARGSTRRNSAHGCRCRITGAGTGRCYGYYVDSDELGLQGNNVHSSSNRLLVEGFESAYFARIGSNDLLFSHFDDLSSISGIDGNISNYFMVSSDVDGELRVTHKLKVGNTLDQNQDVLVVDIGKGETDNPKFYYDKDYFGYTTATWLIPSGGQALLAESSDGPVLMGSMSRGPDAFGAEQRLSVWAHRTDDGSPLNYERRGYRLKRKTDETFALSRHWTYEDDGAFVDLVNIDPWGGMRLRNSDVRVSAIYDEDDMASNSASGICTQQSIKAYVDAAVGTPIHNNLSSLQGGGADEYYHLTFEDYTTITGGYYLPKPAPVSPATYTKITYDENGLVVSGTNATTEDISDTADYRYISDVEKTINKYSLSTGLISGGALSKNVNNIDVDVTAGKSLYADFTNADNPTIEILEWPTQTISGELSAEVGRLWIGIQRIGPGTATFVKSPQFTHLQKRTVAIIGRIWSNGSTSIEGVGQYTTPTYGMDYALIDLIQSLGSLNRSGNIFTPTASGGLRLDKTTGESFRFSANFGGEPTAPNVHTNVSMINIDAYHYHYYNAPTTVLHSYIDPSQYDVNGTLTAVPSGNFTVQRIHYYPKSDVVDLVYGQVLYATLSDAELHVTTESVQVDDINAASLYGSILRGYLIVDGSTTDLLDSNKAKIITASNFGAAGSSSAVGGITVHNQLLEIQGGAVDDYQHLTSAQVTQFITASGNIVNWVIANYPTYEQLTTVSGDIVSWVTNQSYDTVSARTSAVTTTSGDIIDWATAQDYATRANLTTTSGDIVAQMGGKSHSSLLDLDAYDHPQYTAKALNETVSGNWTINTKLGFNNYTNSSPADGERWRQSDHDFRARQNSNTFVDAMNSMCQIRQAAGISPQDCNTSAGVAITWNAQDMVDGLYGHSTSTNPSRITVSGTAWYKINYGVSHINQSNQRKNIATQLRKNGTTLLVPGKAHAISYNTTDAYATNTSASMHRLAAGDYIEVVASGTGSVGSANTAQEGGCWLSVEFVRWSN
jgi:hypothetical protein